MTAFVVTVVTGFIVTFLTGFIVTVLTVLVVTFLTGFIVTVLVVLVVLAVLAVLAALAVLEAADAVAALFGGRGGLGETPPGAAERIMARCTTAGCVAWENCGAFVLGPVGAMPCVVCCTLGTVGVGTEFVPAGSDGGTGAV